jgi:hypothetical protein
MAPGYATASNLGANVGWGAHVLAKRGLLIASGPIAVSNLGANVDSGAHLLAKRCQGTAPGDVTAWNLGECSTPPGTVSALPSPRPRPLTASPTSPTPTGVKFGAGVESGDLAAAL